jgi:hypothetical protein
MKKSSFSESAKSEHNTDYCLSLTQHKRSDSVESVKFIEKYDLINAWNMPDMSISRMEFCFEPRHMVFAISA